VDVDLVAELFRQLVFRLDANQVTFGGQRKPLTGQVVK
jgi:hypothetical protein